MKALLDAYERVIYENNPLAEVLIQVKFPKLLLIDSNPPVDLQQVLMEEYPYYEAIENVQVPIFTVADNKNVQFLRMHNFKSEDGNWLVTLSSEFVALTTTSYPRWEDFRARFQRLIESFIACYNVKQTTRIGLRYKDIIDRRGLGIPETPWTALIRPSVLGIVAENDLHGGNLRVSQNFSTFGHGDIGITLISGFVENQTNNELAYTIDVDIFSEKRAEFSLNDTVARADNLHNYAGPVFRWSITDELHQYLRPAITQPRF